MEYKRLDLTLNDKAIITYQYLSEMDPINYKDQISNWIGEFNSSPILAEEYFYELYSSGKIDHHIKEFISQKENDRSPEKTQVFSFDHIQEKEIWSDWNPMRMLHPAAIQIINENLNDPVRSISSLESSALKYQILSANSIDPNEKFKFDEMSVEMWNAHDFMIIQNQYSLFQRHEFSKENDYETHDFSLEDTPNLDDSDFTFSR